MSEIYWIFKHLTKHTRCVMVCQLGSWDEHSEPRKTPREGARHDGSKDGPCRIPYSERATQKRAKKARASSVSRNGLRDLEPGKGHADPQHAFRNHQRTLGKRGRCSNPGFRAVSSEVQVGKKGQEPPNRRSHHSEIKTGGDLSAVKKAARRNEHHQPVRPHRKAICPFPVWIFV